MLKQISENELLFAFSESLDLLNEKISNHHKEVAYISNRISQKLGFNEERIKRITIAALIHDIGALTFKNKINNLNFDIEDYEIHAINGYNIIKKYKPFEEIAEMVKYHHVKWKNGEGNFDNNGKTIPIGSHIINLADRISVLINKDKHILVQSNEIKEFINKKNIKLFKPELVEVFNILAETEMFWLELSDKYIEQILKSQISDREMNCDQILEMGKFFVYGIDFRSRFTAAHSIGVAATSEKIGELLKFDTEEVHELKVSGYFHDLGKLAVPAEILDKKGKLDTNERKIMDAHPYYTYSILNKIKGFEDIKLIAACHHEKLDGTGYPFKISEGTINFKQRILACADIFTALTEDRPYRKGMDKNLIKEIFYDMVNSNKLDKKIVDFIFKNYDELKNYNLGKQKEAFEDFNTL